jgi:hypothetical protein
VRNSYGGSWEVEEVDEETQNLYSGDTMPVNWYRNYWIHNGLKIVNSQCFPFDYHKTNSGKYKISLRGEPLLSSNEES